MANESLIRQSTAYKEYVKQAKKLGSKEIATPGEFVEVSKRLRKRRSKKTSWVKKLKKNVKKEFKTQRTKSAEAQLRRAGLTEKEIARLRGKK